MNELFNTIFANTSSELTVSSAAVTMLAALLFGGAVAYTYRRTQEGEAYQRSLAVTLFMLPMILSVIILFVGSNVARAFSLAGTLSIIRFRSNPGDAKDIGFIFFAIAAGLACGVGYIGVAIIFVALICGANIIYTLSRFGEQPDNVRELKVTIPEDLNFTGVFDDIFEKLTVSHKLRRVKTSNMGSLYQLTYTLELKNPECEKELIDEMRCRNGNLDIVSNCRATVTEEL